MEILCINKVIYSILFYSILQQHSDELGADTTPLSPPFGFHCII